MESRFLTNEQEAEIVTIIERSLNLAEQFWEQSGRKLIVESSTESNQFVADSIIPSNLPNHETINSINSVNQEMIAIVVDMRNSTRHAKTQVRDINPLKRIFFETFALLPAIDKTIQFENGRVTEYLGDGILGFFALGSDKDKVIHGVSKTAKRIIVDVRNLLNDAIQKKLSLPESEKIDLGIGLAHSQTIIHAIGLQGELHAKAFGSCVYDATKLSSGMNEIFVSENLQAIWPKSDRGKMKFKRFAKDNFIRYKLEFE